ncbi:hypothetical protein Y032_0873g2803 [Ancylostoma ceylanicum]|uniref:Uncharacterized protein n=1 Tax=Ancylostoma ceylanicum TaxID=53326 RepID=A0A016WCB3_9BILA|nr:hypothetical protein Y032_0873g2803 [Ancylostoma ceylanicum]
MPLPLGAIFVRSKLIILAQCQAVFSKEKFSRNTSKQTGLGLFLYFWLLIFLDGLIARLLGSSKSHIHYSREEYYVAEMLSNESIIAPPPPIRPPPSELEESTQEASSDVFK